MKTVARVNITRMIPLLDRQVLMVHVASGDINRDWLGPVNVRCGQHLLRMRCVGVGETGGDPAIMLRLDPSDTRTIQDILAMVGDPARCSLAVERVVITQPQMD